MWPFRTARWIWSGEERPNQFVLFRRVIDLEKPVDSLEVTIYASYHYELYLNGVFINRGPVHGDPAWCQYDEFTSRLASATNRLEVVILAHHSTGTYLHYLTEAPAGLIATFCLGDTVVETDSKWSIRECDSWSGDVAPKNWALGYCEDYDATIEPDGMVEMRFSDRDEGWSAAVELTTSTAQAWSGFTRRITPYLMRTEIRPIRFTAFHAQSVGTPRVFEISAFHDAEKLELIGRPDMEYSSDRLASCQVVDHDGIPARANAFTFDLGAEYAGFYGFEVDAPQGAVVEISGAELLQPDSHKAWIFRKGSCYSARFVTPVGRHRFRTFFWSGFRYLHIVLRESGSAVDRADSISGKEPPRLIDAFCVERSATYVAADRPQLSAPFSRIYDICDRSLRIAGQEFHSDCPTREQAAAWLDGMVSTAAAHIVLNEPAYLIWYFEAFINAPLDEFGLINGRYPGTIGRWVDMCLLPLVAHGWYRRNAGRSYETNRMTEKALVLKKWYDGETDDRGIINFPFQKYFDEGLRTFIDHPGLSMHDADHVGIDRDGASCALNCYFLMFLDELAIIAEESGLRDEAQATHRQADSLRATLTTIFFDGEVFHDCEKSRSGVSPDRLSDGTSWQTNSIAVCAGLSGVDAAAGVMKRMLEGYDTLCRCTPGLSYFFLRALHVAGMDDEAEAYILREWGPMCDAGATTCWETFLGNEKDSLCHPWGVAPLLYFHNAL